MFQLLIFLCLLHVSNPRVYLQEDGYMYRYGVFYIHRYKQSSRWKAAYPDESKTYHITPFHTTVFLKMNR